MPESRDRISRPEEVTRIFAHRRRTIRGLNIFSDDSAAHSFSGTPFRWGTMPLTGAQSPGGGVVAIGRGGGRSSLGTPRSAIGRGRENIRPGSFRRGHGRGTILPSWYPRTPLRDITAVARAIERRRASLRETEEGLQMGSPAAPLQDQNISDPSNVETTPSAQLEHIDFPMKFQTPAAGQRRRCPPSVAKILMHAATNQKDKGENSDCLTPQKKLLNSIDVVGKVVMEELEKAKKTPSAKKAIREKKVRTLMSMR